MKKTIMNIRTMAALLIASAAFTACSNEDGAVIGDQPAATQTPQVYTLTLQAANATGAQHRALELDGEKLVAKWAAGDELTVINVTSMTPLGGTLTASNVSADGKTCTFSGTLTGTIEVGNQLALHYHATSGTQDGTLESAAASDQANAIVTVASAHEGNITISESEASFNTTTAVLKLTLKDGSANALNATSLKMTVDGVDIFTASPTAATYTANGNGVLYFAVPEQFDAAAIIAQEKSGGSPTPELIDTWMTNLNTYDVTFTATVGSDTYTATKTGYKLAAGKYYATTLTMTKLTDLSSISGDTYTVTGDVILTGTPTESPFYIMYGGDDYEVTLDNVNSAGSKQVLVDGNYHNMNIKLKGTSRLKEIFTNTGASNGNTVTIGKAAAGGTLILTGSTDPIRGKTLTINGGTVKSQATGDNWAVYLNNTVGVLTINGGALYLAAGEDGTQAVKGTVSGTLYGWNGSAWVTYTNQRYATTDNSKAPSEWTW